nr:phosphoribosylglycinamide synthetase C domain-containing protein [Olsenella phocaeensis]
MRGDLVEAFLACDDGTLDRVDIGWGDDRAVSVVLTSAGYPGSYERGKPISGIEDAETLDGVTVYHAGTRRDGGGRIVTDGGRVLDVTAVAGSFEDARNLAYQACDRISFEGKTYRHDIGIKAIKGRTSL